MQTKPPQETVAVFLAHTGHTSYVTKPPLLSYYLPMTSKLEKLCQERGLKMTEQRRVISRVMSESQDHPDVEAIHKRAHLIDSRISIATVYRTLRLFEDAGIIERHDFGDGRARYEENREEHSQHHHHHLIDVKTGAVIEFTDPELEAMKVKIAAAMGYDLVDDRLELYGVKREPKTS